MGYRRKINKCCRFLPSYCRNTWFLTIVDNFIATKLPESEALAFFNWQLCIKNFKDMQPNYNFVLWQIRTLENQFRIKSNH